MSSGIWRRRIKRVVLLAVVLGLVGASAAVLLMFPSKDSFDWPTLPAADQRHIEQSKRVVFRFIEGFDAVQIGGHAPGALERVSQYRYLRDSPYLPADRRAASHIFSVAVGKVLVEEDLSMVKHANAIYEGRYALHAPAGRTFTTRIQAVAGGTLSFGVAVLPEFEGNRTCGVSIDVKATGADGVERVLFRTPAVHPSAARFIWTDHVVTLPEGELELSLVAGAEAGCDGPGHAFLSDPTVYGRRGESPKQTNVLYVNICTLRADDVGALGQPRNTTPFIDALAERSVLFTAARSNANWSKASQISALVGRYPSTIGFKHYRVPVSPSEREAYTRLQWPGLAPVLRAHGYDTVSLVDNIFLHDFLNVGLDLGFAQFKDNARHIANTLDLTADAIDWLSARGDRPFFMYMNLANPHYKYRPPREYLAQINLSLSDLLGDLQTPLHLGEVAYTDAVLSRLFESLERLGLAENTVIVLHADHGETLEPERDYAPRVPSSSVPRKTMDYRTTLYKHGWSWQETEVRIPLMVSLPGRLKPARVPRPVTVIDVAPTILGLLGIEVPAQMHGEDLLAQEAEGRPAVVEGKQFRSVTQAGLKFVRFRPGMGRWRRLHDGVTHTADQALYDLVQDAGETTDIAASRPKDVARLSALLDATLPTVEPLHQLAFRGPPGTRFVGQVQLGPNSGGFATTTLRGQGAGEALVVRDDWLSFDLSIGQQGSPTPVLAFSAFEPSPAPPILHLWMDGEPLPLSQLRVGPYALPLAVSRGGGLSVPSAEVLSVGANQVPLPGDPPNAGVRWWRQGLTDGGPEPWRMQAVEANVMDAMKDWGYAQ